MTEKTISVPDQIKGADFSKVAESIVSEYEDRKDNRKHLEKHWDEVDRQLKMVPETSHKQKATGGKDKNKAWMPEVELPFQAQTLEMLMAESRRLKFPRNRDWFTARAALTEKYLKAYEKAGTPIPGEKGENRSTLNQDNGDRLAQAVLSHFHAQYDLRANMDLIDAEAFKYGFGVGRVKKVAHRVLGHDMRGKSGNMKTPMLIPRNARNVYLDDSQHALMHEGHVLGPNIIQSHSIKLADLKSAANDDDSYIKSEIAKLKSDKNDHVTLIELEGDLVYEDTTDTTIIRDVIVTAAVGRNGNNATYGLVRYQDGHEFSTYIISEYNKEGPSHRATSPLIKGMPIAKMLAQGMNRLIESGQLKNTPVISYDPDSPALAGMGGPIVYPGAQWPTLDEIKAHTEIGGDPEVLLAIFNSMTSFYYDVVGVNPARLGAQTKSHTTAFAKDVEATQGASRTVDYVDSSLEGPMTRFLELEYRMGIKDWKEQLVYVQPWNEFVELKKGHLPDVVKFIAVGSSAPAEDQAKTQQKLAAAQLALQIDQSSVQLGNPATVDLPALIQQVLQEGGWTDASEITTEVDATAPDPKRLTGLLDDTPLGVQ